MMYKLSLDKLYDFFVKLPGKRFFISRRMILTVRRVLKNMKQALLFPMPAIQFVLLRTSSFLRQKIS